MDKRQILFLVSGILIVIVVGFYLFSPSKIDSATHYLTSHFNETVGLVYESEDGGNQTINGFNYSYNQIYWIYSDNLLATHALQPYNPQISNMINQTIQSDNS